MFLVLGYRRPRAIDGDGLIVCLFLPWRREKEERKREYEHALAELIRLIDRQQSLTMSTPRFRGIIRVIPTSFPGKAPRSDEEIERLGMEFAMQYERQQGRVPVQGYGNP